LCDEPAAGLWGARFNLGTGRRTNALWTNPQLVMPMQLCAADLDLAQQLPPGDQQPLAALREGQRLVHPITSLNAELWKRGPDVLMLLLRYANGKLWLGADALDLAELRGWLDAAKEGNPEPIVILMGSGGAEERARWPGVVEEASALFAGLIANE